MYPYTFTSSGSLARTYSTPQSDDISAINSIYSSLISVVSWASSSLSSKKFLTSSTGTLNETRRIIQEKGDPKYSNFLIADPSWSIRYQNIQDIKDAADLVVEGQIVEEHGTKFKSKGDYQSYHLNSGLKVNTVLKGDKNIANTEISINQLGGEDDLLKQINNN